jgi:WD40 repeat protein
MGNSSKLVALLIAGFALGSLPVPRTFAGEPTERGSLRGHTNEVLSLAITPDGKTLVSGSLDRTIKLWDLTTLKERATLRGHAGSVIGMALAADGTTLASLSRDGIIKVWDLTTGRERLTLDGPAFGEGSLAISPDGKTLAAGRWGETVKLWDLAGGRERATLKTGRVRCVTFTGDGSLLGVGGSELPGGNFVATLRLWDVPGGQERLRLKGHGGGIRFLISSPDGRTLASTTLDDATVKLWEVLTGRERASFDGLAHGGTSPAFTPDGTTLAAGGGKEGTVKLWDLRTGKELATLKSGANAVHALAFTPDGKTLAAAEGPDTTIQLWDVSGVVRAERSPVPALTDKALEALWADLAGADAAAAYRAIRDLAAAPKLALPWLEKRVQPVATPEPGRIARLLAHLDSDDFSTREKATRELEELGESAGPALRKALAGAPSAELRQRAGPLLAALDRPADSLDRLRVLRAVEALEHAGSPEARRVLEKLAGGLAEARVTREARASLSRLARLSARESEGPGSNDPQGRVLSPQGGVEGVAVDPTGRWLVTESADGPARLWDLKAADPSAKSITLGDKGKRPWAVALTHDGRWLVTGLDDVTIRLWDLTAADPSAKSVVLSSYVVLNRKLNISPDGRWLAVVHGVGRAWLWDLAAKDPSARRFEIGQGRSVRTLAFSASGRWLVTTAPRQQPEAESPDPSAALLWDLRADDPCLNSVVVPGEHAVIGDVTISPDDRWLALRGPDRTARLWDFERYRTVPEAERKAVTAVGRSGGTVETAEGHVIRARFLNARVADADLARLKDFPHLQRLELLGCPVTDAGLAHVAGLKDLRELIVGRSLKVTDAGLEHLKGPSRLERLDVPSSGVTGAGLRHLRGLSRLRSLNLKHNAISDEGVRELKALTGLRYLEMRNTGMTDARLGQLKGLKDLEALGLWGNPLTNACLPHLEELRQLRSLDLSGAEVSEEGLKRLRKALPGLREINLWGTAGPPEPEKPPER